MQIASEATHAITQLDRRLLDVETLMISTLKSDDSWESITYEVRAHEGMATGHLVRVIKYKDFGCGTREDQETYGPLVPVSKAPALLVALNSQTSFSEMRNDSGRGTERRLEPLPTAHPSSDGW